MILTHDTDINFSPKHRKIFDGKGFCTTAVIYHILENCIEAVSNVTVKNTFMFPSDPPPLSKLLKCVNFIVCRIMFLHKSYMITTNLFFREKAHCKISVIFLINIMIPPLPIPCTTFLRCASVLTAAFGVLICVVLSLTTGF